MTAQYRLGIDLGGTKIEGVMLDPAGKILAKLRITTPSGDARGTVEAVAQLVETLERETGQRGTIGIGTPGALSPATGTLRNSNSVCLNGLKLDQVLATRIGRPVRIANDANCFALSEAVDGAGADASIVFGAILGTGVGGGIVFHRRLLDGRHGIAGEWGHNPLPAPLPEEQPGPACYCGRSGCIETFLSGPGLCADHLRVTGQAASPADIAADPQSPTLARYVDRLARALAGVINILDPDVIILGGGISNISALYTAVPARWGRYIFSDVVTTQLRPPVHGDSSGVRGAAWLWPDHA